MSIMQRIGILTAGGDTPALNATIYGAVERANQLGIEVYGILKGFGGLLDSRVPHVPLNPLYMTIPELTPMMGGTILGASRTYIDQDETEAIKKITQRLKQLNIEGLICIGGDGTINGMQPISDYFPCVLAPKTIDNDLGLNYIDEPYEWMREEIDSQGESQYRQVSRREEIDLDGMINYVTPGYATAVFVVAQSIQRIRTTAESHRRIAIVEVMGRNSGYIALGAAYGQPDIILIPEVPLDIDLLEERIRALYDLQKNVVIVIGEGVADENGKRLGETSSSFDPAGNVIFSGAAETLKDMLIPRLGDSYFQQKRRHANANAGIFTRKVGHTQRGGRPIRFDRYYASQLGGKSVDLLTQGQNNTVTTLQWSNEKGFTLDSIHGNKLRDNWKMIHARTVHKSFYDSQRFRPSKLGIEYLTPIFSHAVGSDDLELMRNDICNSGNLTTRYQSINVDIHKRLKMLE